MENIIQSQLAGTWYSASGVELKQTIEQMFSQTMLETAGAVSALILPHAGYRYSGQIACQTIQQATGRRYQRIIVIGPSHRVAMANQLSVPDASAMETPLGQTPLDTEFIDRLRQLEQVVCIPAAHREEPSVQIQLPLLQAAFREFAFVPIVTGELDIETATNVGRALGEMIDDDTLVIASTDFTHYGNNFRYVPFTENVEENLRALDMEGFEHIQSHDLDSWYAFLEQRKPTICGRYAVAILMAMFSDRNNVQLVKYDTSGRLTGDFANSVSYVGAVVTGSLTGKDIPAEKSEGPELDQLSRDSLLELARATVGWFFEHRRAPAVEDLGIEVTENMKREMGAFVTLKKQGNLRGCIGEYPRRAVYRAVMDMALASAFEDRRFNPLEESELRDVTFEISALSPHRVVGSSDNIVLGKHGIIIEKAGRRAVFLPQVATEQGWNLEETLTHLCMKAGLPANGWQEGMTFRVFEANVFHESDES